MTGRESPSRQAAIKFVALAALLSAGSLAQGNEDQADTLMPPARPVTVRASVELAEVSQIQDREQQFQVEFYLYLSWIDPRLAFDPAKVGKDFRILPLDGIWLPEINLIDDLQINVEQPKGVHVLPDGRVTYRQYYNATFDTHFDLHSFPLDRQSLDLKFESAEYDASQLLFAPGELKFEDPDRILPDGWHLTASSLSTGDIADPITKQRLAQLQVALKVDRDFHYYLWTIIFPVLPILAIAWTVFWMDRKEFSTQVTVGLTAMLTLVAYRITIDSSLPALSYITRLDSFLLICELFIFGSFMAVVVMHYCDTRETSEATAAADRLMRASRWLPLLALIAASGWLLILPPTVVIIAVVVGALLTAAGLSRPAWSKRRPHQSNFQERSPALRTIDLGNLDAIAPADPDAGTHQVDPAHRSGRPSSSRRINH